MKEARALSEDQTHARVGEYLERELKMAVSVHSLSRIKTQTGGRAHKCMHREYECRDMLEN
jgi:hypothetical protein